MNWDMFKTIAVEIGVLGVGVGSVLAIVVQIQTVRKLRTEINELKRKQNEQLSRIVTPTSVEIARYSKETRRIVDAIRAERDNPDICHLLEPVLPNGHRVPFSRRSVASHSFLAAYILATFFLISLEVVRFPAVLVIVFLTIAVAALLFVSSALFLGIARDEHQLLLWIISQQASMRENKTDHPGK